MSVDLDKELEGVSPDEAALLAEAARGQCELVTLTVRRWRGGEMVDDSAVSAAGIQLAEEAVSKPRWRLMPAHWNTVFNRHEAKARNAVEQYSTASPIHGSRFVPLASADALFSVLESIRGEFNNSADEFCKPEAYEDMLNEMQGRMKQAWDQAKIHVPPLEKMREKFLMRWFVIPVGSPASAVESDQASSYLQGARAGFGAAMRESLAVMIREPRYKLAALCTNAADLLNQPKRRLNYKSLARVVDEMTSFAGWAFLCDQHTLTEIDTCKQILQQTEVTDLNASQSTALAVSGVLTKIADLLKDEQRMALGLREFQRSKGQQLSRDKRS